MAASYNNVYSINASVAELSEMLKDVRFWGVFNFQFHGESTVSNGAWFRFATSANLSTWGEKIDIYLSAAGETLTNVNIKSECSMPTQIIDWGKNQENVNKIYMYIASHISDYQKAKTEEPQVSQESAPVNEQPVADNSDEESTGFTKRAFCDHCGNKLADDARFCSYCGTKV